MGILAEIYQRFLNVLDWSYQDIWPVVTTFFVMVTVAELIRHHTKSLSGNPWGWLIVITRAGVFLWLMENWRDITGEFLELCITLGISLGQSHITAEEFGNPSLLADQGYRLAWHLLAYQPSGGLWAQIAGLATTILFALIGMIVVMAYYAMAILVLFAFLNIHIAALIGLVLIPFGINRWTVWLAEGVFGSLVSHGVRVMAMAFIANIAFPLVIAHTITVNPTLQSALDLMFLTVVILILFILVPGVAAGLLTGSSSLGSGAILGGALAIGAAPFAAAAGVRGLAQMTMRIGASAGRGSMYLAGTGSALSTAARIGAAGAGPGASLASRGLGAVQGVGKAMAYAASTPARLSMASVSQAYSHAQMAGTRAGYAAMGSSPMPGAYGANIPQGQKMPFVQQSQAPSRSQGSGWRNAVTAAHRLSHLGNNGDSRANFKL